MRRAGSPEDAPGCARPLRTGFSHPPQTLAPGLSTVAPLSAGQLWPAHTVQTALPWDPEPLLEMRHEELSTCTFYFITSACTSTGLLDGMGTQNSLELQLGEGGKPILWWLVFGIRLRDQKSETWGTQWLNPYPTTAFYSASMRTRGSLPMRVSWYGSWQERKKPVSDPGSQSFRLE